jgi:hypothetical protein
MANPMDRKMDVTAADLFVLLDREFRRRKSRDCAACVVQLPYRVHGAAWEVVTPASCAHGCNAVFEEIVRDFQRLYALKQSNQSESA